jgi:hypothetical protein
MSLYTKAKNEAIATIAIVARAIYNVLLLLLFGDFGGFGESIG